VGERTSSFGQFWDLFVRHCVMEQGKSDRFYTFFPHYVLWPQNARTVAASQFHVIADPDHHRVYARLLRDVAQERLPLRRPQINVRVVQRKMANRDSDHSDPPTLLK
jgi:hypothetical protein